jgi:hypothetical protein
MSTDNFAEACATYKLLREKGYPEKATLKLVGDRHRLSRMQRNCLFRGVIVHAAASLRKAKIVAPNAVSGQALGVDWYNVLITVESYLRGQVLFVADDGMVRDASATHGSYRTASLTGRAMEEIVQVIAGLAPFRVDAYLDMPIAFSGLMAEDLRARLAPLPCASEVALVPSADYPLKTYEGIVASSDSAVVDGCALVLDLARAVLAGRFGFNPPAIHDLFPGSPGSPPQ